MNSNDDTIRFPLHHPALKKHWLLKEFGFTDNNAITKALKLKQKLREEEARKGIGLK